MSVKERLKKYIKSQNSTISHYEKLINVSNGYVNSISKGVGGEVLLNILEKSPNLNIEWLLSGNGNMLKSAYQIDESTNNLVEEPQEVFRLRTDHDIPGNQVVPLYDDYEAIAGLTPMFNNHQAKEPASYISIPNLPKCDGAIPITGDSMYPLLKSGDIVMFKRIEDIKNGIFFGEMYLVSLMIDDEEYITVKYIQKSEKGEQFVKLVSQNSHHQPKDVLIRKINALAIVKASIRINSMN